MPSKLDPEQMRFGALVRRIVEKEMRASLSDDRGGQLISGLFHEYQTIQTTKPPAEEWIREKCKGLFLSAGDPPRWVEKLPIWPFYEGKPMTFVGQMETKGFKMPDGKEALPATLYMFAIGVDSPGTGGGWETRFRVVQQFRDLSA